MVNFVHVYSSFPILLNNHALSTKNEIEFYKANGRYKKCDSNVFIDTIILGGITKEELIEAYIKGLKKWHINKMEEELSFFDEELNEKEKTV